AKKARSATAPRPDLRLEIMLVIRIRKNLSGDQQWHARNLCNIERQVKSFLGADPAQGQREIALGVPRLQPLDRNSAQDRRQHHRQWWKTPLLRGGDTIEPGPRARRRDRTRRVEFGRQM